ncbi:MAG: type II CAAX endopeptidase family protein [Gemmatimonadetes bacterium]|nr:type II CAAX endopeptidase family protein [Gemmatimonadota bacterium]
MNETPLNAIEPEGPSAPPRLRYTLVSTALILGAYLVLQIAATVAAMAILGLDPAARMGDLVALGVIFSAVPCTFLVLHALGLARGVDPKSWLALVPVRPAALLGWLVFAVLLLQLADLVTVELGRSPVPPVMETIMETTRYTTLLWVALVIAAPVFEEALFRGFMFEGLRRTRIGAWGTIAVTTLLWTLLHVGQYDQYFLVLIALIGILLGFARERTGSLYVPLAIHAVNNLLSTLQLSEERDTLVNGLF